MTPARNFAITGVAGYIAPRHLKAIADTGNRLIAATDPHDSVGILDRFAFDCRFFTEFERFDRHLEKLRRGAEEARVHCVSVCSPNYLHDAHMRLALRVGEGQPMYAGSCDQRISEIKNQGGRKFRHAKKRVARISVA